jgi:hypothetical protein
VNGIPGVLGKSVLPSEAGKAWNVLVEALKYLMITSLLEEEEVVQRLWVVVEKLQS